jgi:hypothetical protein
MKKAISIFLTTIFITTPFVAIADTSASSTTSTSTSATTTINALTGTTTSSTIQTSSATSSVATSTIYTIPANPNAVAMSTSTILYLSQRIPDGFQFQSDLSYGSYNQEVYVLQMILNTDTRTMLAQTDYGSAGNESWYFGTMTQDAVNRFQQVYAFEILTPAGLTNPTGIVGARTRTVLNRIVANIKTLAAIINSTNQTISNNLTPTQVNTYINNMVYGSEYGYGGTGSTSGNKTNKTGLIVAGAVVAAAVAINAASAGSSVASNATQAITNTGFGGKIVYVDYCTCMASIMLYILDLRLKSVIQLMYMPGVSSLKMNYNIFTTGNNVLGGYTPIPMQCMVVDGTDCSSHGTARGIIDFYRGVGTSAI